MTTLLIAMNISALDLPTKTINGTEYYYYKVKPGDTLYSLSHRFNTTRDIIAKHNPSAANAVKPGDTLYFPINETTATDNKPVKPEEELILHKVKKGESLYGISKRYDVSIDDIIALNPGCETKLKGGTTLKIPSRNNNNNRFSGATHVVTEKNNHGTNTNTKKNKPPRKSKSKKPQTQSKTAPRP